MDSFLRTRLQENIVLMELDSPDGYPRLTRSVLGELFRQFQLLRTSSEVYAVVISGTDRAFASGADLVEVSELSPTEALRFSALGQGVMASIETSPKPVIASIRAHCLGGGFDLALACHLRVAADDARFGHPGGSLGIITGWGGTARLARIAGRARALELFTSGRTIAANEALHWKIVSRVVPPQEVAATAFEFAKQAAARSTSLAALL